MKDSEKFNLNIEMAKISDFVFDPNKDEWQPKNGTQFYNSVTLPFIDSIDALLKWPVPRRNIVGINFRFLPGGCECVVTYQDKGGFGKETAWIGHRTNNESTSRELAPLALCRAIKQI